MHFFCSLIGMIQWTAESLRDSLVECCWPTVASSLVNWSRCRKAWRKCSRMHRWLWSDLHLYAVRCGTVCVLQPTGLRVRVCESHSVPEVTERSARTLGLCESDEWAVIHHLGKDGTSRAWCHTCGQHLLFFVVTIFSVEAQSSHSWAQGQCFAPIPLSVSALTLTVCIRFCHC